MAVYFTGTSTGDRYQVGAAYSTSRGTVVAQSDGSFRNVTTGSVSRGSAGNSDVSWYATGSDVDRFQPAQGSITDTASIGSHNGPRQAALPSGFIRDGKLVAGPVSQGGNSQTGKPSSGVSGSSGGGGSIPGAGAPVAGSGSVKVTPANNQQWRGAFIRDAAWSGKDEPAQDNLFAGYHWQANPKFTNAEEVEARYGDVMSALWGAAIFAGDMGFNASRAVFGPNHQTVDKWAVTTKAVDNAAMDFGDNMVDFGFSMVDSARAWAADNAAREAAAQRARDDFNSAWDLREELQAQEANMPRWNGTVSPGNVWY